MEKDKKICKDNRDKDFFLMFGRKDTFKEKEMFDDFCNEGDKEVIDFYRGKSRYSEGY